MKELQLLNQLSSDYRKAVSKTPWSKSLIDDLINDFTYHSSKIEGLTLNYHETVSYLKFGFLDSKNADPRTSRDIASISNHKEILKVYFEEYNSKEISEQSIREAQCAIYKTEYQNKAFDIYNAQLGEYKNHTNGTFILGENGIGRWKEFLAPHLVRDAMKKLITNTNNALKTANLNIPDSHPIIIAAKFHYDFVHIHPFEDGNGRTARLFTNLIVMKNDFPPLLIRGEGKDRDRYINAIMESEPVNIIPLALHFIDEMKNTILKSLDIVNKNS